MLTAEALDGINYKPDTTHRSKYSCTLKEALTQPTRCSMLQDKLQAHSCSSASRSSSAPTPPAIYQPVQPAEHRHFASGHCCQQLLCNLLAQMQPKKSIQLKKSALRARASLQAPHSLHCSSTLHFCALIPFLCCSAGTSTALNPSFYIIILVLPRTGAASLNINADLILSWFSLNQFTLLFMLSVFITVSLTYLHPSVFCLLCYIFLL